MSLNLALECDSMFQVALQQRLRFCIADFSQDKCNNAYVFLALEAGLMPVSLGNQQIGKRLMEGEVM